MTEQHPITPPQKLVQQWIIEGRHQDYCSFTGGIMTNKTDPYVACSSLEWKLGIHLSEWKAARDLAKRLNKDPCADAAYLQGVKNLLNDYLSSFQPMQLTNLVHTSKRQDPVVDKLADLLDSAKAVAAAISDNAIEEQLPIPKDLLRSFNNDLERIKAHLLTAADVPEKIYTAS